MNKTKSAVLILMAFLIFAIAGCSNSKERIDPKKETPTREASLTGDNSLEINQAELPTYGEKDLEELDLDDLELGELKMQVHTLIVTTSLSLSNRCIIDAFSAQSRNEFKTNMEQAVNLLNQCKQESEEFLPEENLLNSKLDSLIENYQATLTEVTGIKPQMTDEEFANLAEEGTNLHFRVFSVMRCYTSLYGIRRYAQLSEEEAEENLDYYWEYFLLPDGFEKPEKLNKLEVYGMWLAIYFPDCFQEEEFLDELENLIINDDVTDKEMNLKWLNFIQKFLNTTQDLSEITV